MHRHLVIGLEGPVLSADERRMLRDHPPLGVILFTRNTESPEQVSSLLAEVREMTGEQTWAVVDEEGGRVNRMPWAPFNERKPAAFYGERWQRDADASVRAVYEDNRRTGEALVELGFTHDCAPVLDLFHARGHGVIGDRAYGVDAEVVAALGTACMRGLSDAGIEAVGKHFPGHGRANADSHFALPRVDACLETLLAEARPFAKLAGTGLSHVMSAHVVYADADDRPATFSPFWLGEVLRRRFAFSGSIWSDDLCMAGAGPDVPEAARAARAAGCDVLLVCQPQGVACMYAALGELC